MKYTKRRHHPASEPLVPGRETGRDTANWNVSVCDTHDSRYLNKLVWGAQKTARGLGIDFRETMTLAEVEE